MNPRLQELYQQAHSIRRHDSDPLHQGDAPTVYWQGDVSAGRFAQLIIEQCVTALNEMHTWQSVNNQNYPRAWHDAVEDAIKQLRQHFGVEE
jgi:hypothetical protein